MGKLLASCERYMIEVRLPGDVPVTVAVRDYHGMPITYGYQRDAGRKAKQVAEENGWPRRRLRVRKVLVEFREIGGKTDE